MANRNRSSKRPQPKHKKQKKSQHDKRKRLEHPNFKRKKTTNAKVPLTVTVCHYPPGASKWNPADHRLHSEISKNWAGKPLDSYETALNYIRTTTTRTGLRVRARLERKHYAIGEKIADWEMTDLCLNRHETNPNWNYTLTPHPSSKM